MLRADALARNQARRVDCCGAWSELDEVEAAPRGATLQALRERWPPVLDVLRELSWADPVRYQPSPPARDVDGRKVGRNDPCPCGSGRKYKKCCGG